MPLFIEDLLPAGLNANSGSRITSGFQIVPGLPLKMQLHQDTSIIFIRNLAAQLFG